MELKLIEVHDPVIYIPNILDRNIKDENLGIVTSKNEKYVFVRYLNNEVSKATNPDNLYTLKNRPDLKEKLGIKIYPIDRLHEIYLLDKKPHI